MKARITTATLALLIAPGITRAEGIAKRFSVAVQAGTQSEVAGNFLASSDGTLVGKPASVTAKRYRDIYRPVLRLQGMVGYGLTPRVEAFARATYYAPEAISIEGGTFAGKPLFMCFEASTGTPSTDCAALKRKEYGAEIGLRYYIAPQSRLKSFFSVVGGARHSDELLVSLSMPDAGSAILHVPFSRGATVAVFGADLGFVFDLTPHAFLGIETGLRYQPAPSRFGALPTLGAWDASDPRWTAPVVVTFGARF